MVDYELTHNTHTDGSPRIPCLQVSSSYNIDLILLLTSKSSWDEDSLAHQIQSDLPMQMFILNLTKEEERLSRWYLGAKFVIFWFSLEKDPPQ